MFLPRDFTVSVLYDHLMGLCSSLVELLVRHMVDDVVTHERTAHDAGDVHGLESLLALDDVESNVLSLTEGAEVAVEWLDARVVDEDVLASVGVRLDGDEAVSVGAAEPFDKTDFCSEIFVVRDFVHY